MALPDDDNLFGVYLRDRRARLNPVALGFNPGRRRTPGLRREEVAQRANVSATWYTWLEQGRGGAPSTVVLDRLSKALALTTAEREHLYLLSQRRPLESRYEAIDRVSPQFQCVLDAMQSCPAIVKNSIWDIVAWNSASTKVLTDYAALPPERRNMLRLLFTDRRIRDSFPGWEAHVRFVVAVFRADIARSGASKRAEKLIMELCDLSAEFKEMWHDNEVRTQEDGTKRFNLPDGGQIALDYSTFAVSGHPGLTMMVYTPATSADAGLLSSLIYA